jgi:hypothetical protein
MIKIQNCKKLKESLKKEHIATTDIQFSFAQLRTVSLEIASSYIQMTPLPIACWIWLTWLISLLSTSNFSSFRCSVAATVLKLHP